MADPDRRLAGPDPETAGADEIYNYLTTLGAHEARQWLEKNYGSMRGQVRNDVENRFRSSSSLGLGDSPEAVTYRAVISTFDGIASKEEDEIRTNQRIESNARLLEETGMDPEAAREEAERAERETAGISMPVPDAIMQVYGKEPSLNQKNELIQAWNELNPDAPVRTWQDLASAMNEVPGDPFNSEVVGYAVTGLEPQKVFEIEVAEPGMNYAPGMFTAPSTMTVRVSENQLAAMQQIYGSGFNSKDIKMLAQLAGRIGLRDALGQGNGWMMLAAGAAALGMWNIGTRATQAANDVERNTIDPETARAIGVAGTVMNDIARTGTAITRKEQDRLRNWGIKFKNGMSQYGGNETLAFLHAMNASLAAKVATTKFDDLSLSDRKRAMSFMMQAGFGQEQLEALGYGWAAGLNDIEANQDESGGRTVVRQLPDPDAVKQSVRDMYMQLFATEPDDAQLQQLVSSVTGALTSNDVDGSDGTVQDVNAEAQIRKRLEALPEYGDLYGKKPAGMTEAEYQQQFRAGAASILGNAAARPDVIKAGMRSGDYNTTVGAAAMTREAWEGSSFLGRLAQAAQIVSENT